ncbi:MAG: hypothetical protein KF789_08030 [Bdellovibrionaceae bacterium]|nr:hypothetical protein [Pseudobdellovibrionaceae bacterium]
MKMPDSEMLTLEFSVRLSVKDWKAKLGVRKAWIVALVVALLRLAIHFWLNGS